MVQLVIKNGYVLAVHSSDQILRDLYPGCEIVEYAQPLSELPSDVLIRSDPRTDEEKLAAYRDQRRLAYPSIGDQLDMIYWDQINGTRTWHDAVAAVKAQYPAIG